MSLSGVARLGPFSCETKKQWLFAVKAPEKDKEEIQGIFSMGSQVKTSENRPPAAEKR